MRRPISKAARLIWAIAALFAGSILKSLTNRTFFFWLGLIACVAIFGFLGRGEQFSLRRKARQEKRAQARPDDASRR